MLLNEKSTYNIIDVPESELEEATKRLKFGAEKRVIHVPKKLPSLKLDAVAGALKEIGKSQKFGKCLNL